MRKIFCMLRALPAKYPSLRFGAVAGLFVAMLAFALARTHPHSGGDTAGWEAAGRQIHAWRDVLSTQRPPIYPLLLRITGFSHPCVIAVQSIVYAAAWIFLAASLWRRKCFIAACVFYVALYPGFAAWNTTLMTESLAISMTVLCFGCLARCLDGSPGAIWAFAVLMALKCFLRNFDALLCLFYLPVIILLAGRHAISWRACVGATAVLGSAFVYFGFYATQYADYTWYFALLSDVGMRVLPDPGWLAYFMAHGMPASAKLLSMTGHWAYDNNWRFFDADLAPFRDWLRAHGRATYMGYLLAHPGAMLSPLWRDRRAIFQGAPLSRAYFDPGYAFVIPPWPPFSFVYAANAIGCAGLGVALWRGARPAVVTTGTTAG